MSEHTPTEAEKLKERNRINQANFRRNHPERVEQEKARLRQYWLDNKERVKAQQAAYRAANPEKVKATAAASAAKIRQRRLDRKAEEQRLVEQIRYITLTGQLPKEILTAIDKAKLIKAIKTMQTNPDSPKLSKQEAASLGGLAGTGEAKRRGDSDYYRQLRQGKRELPKANKEGV